MRQIDNSSISHYWNSIKQRIYCSPAKHHEIVYDWDEVTCPYCLTVRLNKEKAKLRYIGPKTY